MEIEVISFTNIIIYRGKNHVLKFVSKISFLNRKEYQGVKPPTDRSDDHYDAAANYHLTANIDYIKYFVSTITQFQLHRSLCVEAEQYDKEDHTKSLYNCDIYNSKEAGFKLAYKTKYLYLY